MENWQSEYLQFTLYILLTVWFVQKGSPESKELDKAGRESDEEQQRRRARQPDSPAWARVARPAPVALLELAADRHGGDLAGLLVRAVGRPAGATTTPTSSTTASPRCRCGSYVGTAHFWEATLQNWQSEFLAVGSMAVLAVYLRQRASIR